MSVGTLVIPDFIPAGQGEPFTGDPSKDTVSAVDLKQDFTLNAPVVAVQSFDEQI